MMILIEIMFRYFYNQDYCSNIKLTKYILIKL